MSKYVSSWGHRFHLKINPKLQLTWNNLLTNTCIVCWTFQSFQQMHDAIGNVSYLYGCQDVWIIWSASEWVGQSREETWLWPLAMQTRPHAPLVCPLRQAHPDHAWSMLPEGPNFSTKDLDGLSLSRVEARELSVGPATDCPALVVPSRVVIYRSLALATAM